MSEAKWQSYPRPQMRRNIYMNLNGTWEVEGQKVQVPFPLQSRLSEWKGEVPEKFTYTTTFTIPEEFTLPNIMIHFGAVDEIVRIYVNGLPVLKHGGGYLHFWSDITRAVKRNEVNELKVVVEDELTHVYPYGKQSKKRGGMWYTPVSGIWQTVWLENLPDNYIERIKLTPSLTDIEISIQKSGVDRGLYTKFKDGFTAIVSGKDGIVAEQHFKEDTGKITIPNPIHWTPENPYLYDLKIVTGEDEVDSYFALRTVSVEKINGVNYMCLNGNPIFMHGLLDQGYYEDGIYLPEDEEEYTKDILRMKELGFNMLRKHIKIEPEKFYYECDRLGMLVVQDMVNNGGYSYILDTVLPTLKFKKRNDRKGRYHDSQCMRVFENNLRLTIRDLYNHPCIIGYTIFNEGWGQFNSDDMYDIAKECDSTRFFDSTSGWFAQKKSDVDSEHIYFRAEELHAKERPMFLSECGGFSYKVEGHVFNEKDSYGYGACESSEELTDRIVNMYEVMVLPGIKGGVCGCVYTQVSDVEDEINGMYTYDRQVCKVNKERMQELATRIYKEIDEIDLD